MAVTSTSLAICTLVLLPFDIITWGLRFYVRLSRKAWGPDDWAMLIAIPLFTVSTVAMLGIATTGGGLKDTQLTTEQRKQAMFWWFVMETMWCFAAIPVKWSIGLTLLRIANRQRVYVTIVWTCMIMVFLVMASTSVYEFFHCKPVAYNWDTSLDGKCNSQANITGFSFALSAVSIFTDWVFAIMPIPLLWNVQMDPRIKMSVIALLSLGIFASVSAIVRLTITVNLSAAVDFLYNSMGVCAWAQAELGIGVVVANLPALRPLLEKVLALRSTLMSSSGKNKTPMPSSASRGFIELDEGLNRSHNRSQQRPAEKGNLTRVYGGDLEHSSDSSIADDHSQNRIVSQRPNEILVNHQVDVREGV